MIQKLVIEIGLPPCTPSFPFSGVRADGWQERDSLKVHLLIPSGIMGFRKQSREVVASNYACR